MDTAKGQRVMLAYNGATEYVEKLERIIKETGENIVNGMDDAHLDLLTVALLDLDKAAILIKHAKERVERLRQLRSEPDDHPPA